MRRGSLRAYGDAGVAVAVAVACAVMGLLGQPDWLWSSLMGLTLAGRHARPLTSALLATAISSTHMLTTGSLLFPGDVVLLVAAYSVAAHAADRLRHASLALGACFVVVLGARTLTGQELGSPGSVGLVIALVSLSFAIAWAVGLLERRRREAVRIAELRTLMSERDADARTRLAAYEERERMSDDMHDVLAHTLTSVIVQAESGRATASSPESTEMFRTISESGRAALQEVRGLLAPAVADVRPVPGWDDLDALVEGFRRSGIRVDREDEGAPRPLLPGMGVAVYRVVQESLTNAVRHGEGDAARLRVEWSQDALTVTVANRVAPDRAHRPVEEHRGLTGIRRRGALYGGQAGYACGDEFVVRARWPTTPPPGGITA
jgi:signal transduction histidine kinase